MVSLSISFKTEELQKISDMYAWQIKQKQISTETSLQKFVAKLAYERMEWLKRNPRAGKII